jgi:PAS domain S-box-containing protein
VAAWYCDFVLELVIEAMVDAVLVVDADGRITMANAGAAQLTGYTLDELRGRPVAELLIDEHSGLRSVVRRRIEHGNVLRREEAWLVDRGGARIPVSLTGSPVVDADGGLQGIVLVARDVRELRQLLADKEAEIGRRRLAEDNLRAAKDSIEKHLQEVRAMLVLAERRATLGTLAGGVGHELRNIAQIQLAAVDQLAVALAADERIEALARHLLPDLERVGEHVALHGNKLMQLARPGPDRVEPTDLNAIVRDVIAMLELAGKLGGVEIVLVLSETPVQLTVNRARIEQILVNLVINAVDAIASAPGKITIEAKPTDGGRRVTCSVRDTGCGIPREHLAKIFEPFFTTKLAHGTGLGLPVVQEIIASYGGTLAVESEPGRGTTFTFELPV